MTTPSVGVERRIGQRFAFNLPVSLRDLSTRRGGTWIHPGSSAPAGFLFTDMPLSENAEVELTLRMPSEITLGENMRVSVAVALFLRIVQAADKGWNLAAGDETKPSETKIGVAVCLKGYEYLPEVEDSSADFRRISALHSAGETERTIAPVPGISASRGPLTRPFQSQRRTRSALNPGVDLPTVYLF